MGSNICVCAHIGDVSLDGHGSRRVCQGVRLGKRARSWTKASQGRPFLTNELFLHGPRTTRRRMTCPMAICQKDLLSKWGQGHGKKLGVKITTCFSLQPSLANKKSIGIPELIYNSIMKVAGSLRSMKNFVVTLFGQNLFSLPSATRMCEVSCWPTSPSPGATPSSPAWRRESTR